MIEVNWLNEQKAALNGCMLAKVIYNRGGQARKNSRTPQSLR
jgi:hypothetical protein